MWSPYQQPESLGDLEGEVEDKSRSLYTHEEYISLVLNSGSGLSHDYVSQSIQEDPRMMAFFDSLVRREIEGWSSDSDSDLSEEAIMQLHARGRRTTRAAPTPPAAASAPAPPSDSADESSSSSSSSLAGPDASGRDGQAGEEDEEEEEDDGDYGLLPPPQPRLTRLPHSRTFGSMRDWRRSTGSLSTPPSAPCSTPPCPSAGFALQAPPPTPGPGSRVGGLCAAERLGFRPGSGEERAAFQPPLRAPPADVALSDRLKSV